MTASQPPSCRPMRAGASTARNFASDADADADVVIEADAGFYAIQAPETAARWVERTPDHFVFNVKAHALMTGHATDVARLPGLIRDELPPELAAAQRIYAKDLPPELRDVAWRLFRD